MQTGFIAPASSTSTSGTTGTSGSTLGQSAFLQLLVTELQNQDPTSAQDPNTMITQMAQFSGVEQQTDTNTLLNSLQGQISAMFQAQTSSLIGTNVQVTSPSLDLSGGTASIGISLPSAAAKVSVAIQNAAGQTVATLTPGAMAAGNQVLNWNGTATNGTQLPDGTYTVNITAVDASGKAVAATTTSNATVTAVNFANGTIMVTAGGQQYPLSSINQISS
jgi:flagellar basal-body rod modification protein FlgD